MSTHHEKSNQRDLTGAQRTAIHEHKRNLIVVAGAGSGKTFVLVERYLTLLDENPTWPLSALVAITFTKKAAQEMRDRVRKTLEQRLSSAQTTEEQALWANRMGTMDSARIDTIHGLCASILRANAAEAGIDPAFEVLDEVGARLLLDDCIDDVLQTIAQDEDETVQLFTQYDTQIIRQAVINLVSEQIETPPDDILDVWQQLWEENAAVILTDLRNNTAYQAVINWIPANGWPTGTDKLMDVWTACRSFISTLNESEDTGSRIEAVTRLANAINLQGGSKDAWGSPEQVKESKAALSSLRDIARQTLTAIGEPPGTLDEKAAQFLPLWAKLITNVQEVYRSRKAEEGALDFDDLEQLTRDLLMHFQSVRERYQGTEFKHLLVDEFQDTNATQWEIVRGLANVEQGGSLFVVGDPKQSIYQFRGADVSVFKAVQEQIRTVGGIDVPLAKSFRTHQTLVNGFNHLFGQILVRDASSPVRHYEVELGEAMQAHRKDAPSGEIPIELLFIDKTLSEDNLDAEGIRRWEASEIAKRLKSIVEDEQRPVYDKELGHTRPINYGDVAILYQSMSNILIYEDVFKTAKLPFVTIAGKGYYSRQEVWDLLNLLTALHNPSDNLALASALRSPLFGLSDDALLALRLQRRPENPKERMTLWDAIQNPIDMPKDEQTRVGFAGQCLNRLRVIAGRVSIADLLHAALDETGYLATLTGLPDGARRRGNVEKLLDKAQESRQVTLGAFSEYLRDLTSREVREGEALVDVKDSVTLMTVHASKGLEFPLVVLVDIGWSKGNSNRDTVAVDPRYGLVCKVYDPVEEKFVAGFAHGQVARLQNLREIAERKRLLYVAATRAQDYLIISGHKLKTAKNTWLEWISAAFEIGEEDLQAGTRVINRDRGMLQIRVPDQPPEEGIRDTQDTVTANRWEQIYTPQVVDDRSLLTREINVEISSAIRHITATQIADAGGAYIDPLHRRRFRRSILKDAPLTIDQVSLRKPQDVSQRIIGEMVHKVLGWWDFKDNKQDFDDRLDSYAWELGVVDEGQRKYAIQEAHKLLTKMLKSPIIKWLLDAQQIYREIPFVYRSDKRIIHGVLDTLFQQPDGTWVIVDYKTSYVTDYKTTADEKLLSNHALRYHLQIGVYAAAVQEQLGGIVPETYIYYIRYGQYVRVEQSDWISALNRLEATIGDLLTEQAD